MALLPGASSAHPLTPANARTLAAANVNDDMSFTIGKVRQVADELTGNISTLANTSRTNASTDLLVTSLVTLLLLLLVALVSTIVARSLIRPLRKLRADALDVAGNRLPEMVRRLSQSEGADEGVEIEPIGVTSTDEIGEVARAFDQVHREAVRLAADEAMLRGNLNAMFINLSRRSQSLIERQLSLIDSLEQSEQDSGRLSSLFRLDHLATRMRRNSENLLVLAGHEVTRRWSQPVPLVDVLRAAISEIEQYERVVLNVQPGIVVVGQAVNDVVHLVAEIVENATTFSPEDTQVYVSGQPLSSGGVLLDITDNGVGISDQEMSHANWRLDNPPVVDVAVSRRMGLFVVGRLAARHGVRVRLRHAQAGGLTALIWLPDTVAAPEVAPPLGRLRRFEAEDFGPAPRCPRPPRRPRQAPRPRPRRPRGYRGSRPARRRPHRGLRRSAPPAPARDPGVRSRAPARRPRQAPRARAKQPPVSATVAWRRRAAAGTWAPAAGAMARSPRPRPCRSVTATETATAARPDPRTASRPARAPSRPARSQLARSQLAHSQLAHSQLAGTRPLQPRPAPAGQRGAGHPGGSGRSEQAARVHRAQLAGTTGSAVPDRQPERPRQRRAERVRRRRRGERAVRRQDQQPGHGRPGRGFRSGDDPGHRGPGAAAADLRLAGVRLVPPERADHDHHNDHNASARRAAGGAGAVDVARR